MQVVHRPRLFRGNPAVIFDVQRAAPSTGMPTRTQQCDIISCAFMPARRYQTCVVVPGGNPTEAFEFGAQVFDLASDWLQTPILVFAVDLDTRHEYASGSSRLVWDDNRAYDTGWQGHDSGGTEIRQGFRFAGLDVDGDGIPYRTYPVHASHQGPASLPVVRSKRSLRQIHRGSRAPTSDVNMQRLVRKFDTWLSTWYSLPLDRQR